ncbi:MAG: hypothetical protein P4L64_00205 [Caulobacteraceae bacterium]|nr:hypothetical protein [Caulobacteraceae bacterium]
MTQTNPDLQQLQNSLGDLLDSLTAAQDAATDPATIQAIAGQIAELNHRITATGGLIFHQQTQAITDAVQQVTDQTAKVQAAIAHIADIAGFVNTISGFLGLVDKALAVAKLV